MTDFYYLNELKIMLVKYPPAEIIVDKE